MNKKLRFVSAAATALLAVAPVATSAIAPVATTFAATTAKATNVTVSPSTSYSTVSGSVTDADGNTTGGDSVDAYLQSGSVSLNSTSGNVSLGKITITDNATSKALTSGQKFVGGHVYTQTINFGLYGLTAGQSYNVNRSGDKVANNGILSSYSVTRTIYATESTDSTQPYFTADGVQVANNALIAPSDGSVGYATPTTAANLSDLAKSILTDAEKRAVVHQASGNVVTTVPEIESQLSTQGVSVDAKGNVVSPSGFVVTLTALNANSGKTVTVRVPYAPVATTPQPDDVTGYPVISYNDGETSTTAQGADIKAKNVDTIELGSSFDPIKAVSAKAATSDASKSALTVSVVSNPVNTAVPGKYTVVLSATDWTTGKTTKLSYTVQVGKADETFAKVQYIPGYSVVEWKVLGNTVSLAGSKALDGTTVQTFEKTTVNGISYTRVGSATSNTWIQTQYLDGSWKPQPKPDNGETKVSGVATVTYKGAGKVRLVNSNGKYVSQYVSKGSHWKVFAKKTINGNVYYRIGSQSQWVPAKYVSVK